MFNKVERQGRHAPAPAVAVSDARQAAAASGDAHVDQDTKFVPWLQGLSVTELDAVGESAGDNIGLRARKSPNEQIWQR